MKTPKRARVTRDEFTVQGNYGQGWEDVTAEDTRKEARARLREYRENEPGYAHRIIKRRVKLSVIPEGTTTTDQANAYLAANGIGGSK